MKAVVVSTENLIVEVGNQRTTKPATKSKDAKKAVIGLSAASLGLDGPDPSKSAASNSASD